MVGQSDRSDNAVFVWFVFADFNARARVGRARKTKNAPSRLVSKGDGDLFGCDWLCEAANMGVAEFSNVGCGGRDNKNTALISGMFDRYSVLRFLIWMKSS